MIKVLRNSLAPLLLASGLAALAGCSGYHSEAATAPNANNAGSCAVGATAQHPACDTYQDQGEMRSNH